MTRAKEVRNFLLLSHHHSAKTCDVSIAIIRCLWNLLTGNSCYFFLCAVVFVCSVVRSLLFSTYWPWICASLSKCFSPWMPVFKTGHSIVSKLLVDRQSFVVHQIARLLHPIIIRCTVVSLKWWHFCGICLDRFVVVASVATICQTPKLFKRSVFLLWRFVVFSVIWLSAITISVGIHCWDLVSRERVVLHIISDVLMLYLFCLLLLSNKSSFIAFCHIVSIFTISAPDKTNQRDAFECHVSISPLVFKNRQFDRVRMILCVFNLLLQWTSTYTNVSSFLFISFDAFTPKHALLCALSEGIERKLKEITQRNI